MLFNIFIKEMEENRISESLQMTKIRGVVNKEEDRSLVQNNMDCLVN